MANSILVNDNLKSFVQQLEISQDKKDTLLLKIPKLDREERLKLLDVLSEMYLSTLEEKKAIEKIKADWDKERL